MHPERNRQRARPQRDPRLYQIAVLGGLILYGMAVLDFGIDGMTALVLLTTAQLVQLGATRAFDLPRFDPRSALISSLSLVLLLRTNSLLLAASVAAVTIASKFVLRWSRGGAKKHIWNPTNLGLALGMLATNNLWVSPGQWGTAALFGFLLAGLGMLVTHRAARSDVTWSFLVAYAVIVHARALWLGDPLSIPRHQLANGGFLIFAFFMISDPKTTPDTRFGRVVFATLVACVAGFIQFGLFRPSGLIWALFFLAPLVPLIDTVSPGPRYRWRRHGTSAIPSHAT